MKVIIAGSRHIRDEAFVEYAVQESKFEISELVSGGAVGVDYNGELYAELRDIPITRFKANWDKYGLKAGPIRNKDMAKYADALILIWDGKSKGSKNMLKEMRKLNKPIFELIVNTEGETTK